MVSGNSSSHGSYVPPVLDGHDFGGANTAVAAAIALHNLPNISADELLQQKRERRQAKRQQTVIVAVVGTLSVVLAVFALREGGSWLVYLATLVPFVAAPTAMIQRRKLNKMPTFVHELNHLRAQANRLMQQNVKFAREQLRLHAQLRKFHLVEQRLQVTAAHNQMQVTELENLIVDNGIAQRKMKKLAHAKEVQRFLAAVLAADTNRDATLSEVELDHLMLQLKAFTHRPLDESALRQALWASQTASATSLYRVASPIYFGDDRADEDLWSMSYGQCA